MSVVGLYATPTCEKILFCLEAIPALLTLCVTFLSTVLHVWNQEGIYFNLFAEGSSQSQMVVFSEHVFILLVFSPKLDFFSALKVLVLKAWNMVLPSENTDCLKRRTEMKFSYRKLPIDKNLCQ